MFAAGSEFAMERNFMEGAKMRFTFEHATLINAQQFRWESIFAERPRHRSTETENNNKLLAQRETRKLEMGICI